MPRCLFSILLWTVSTSALSLASVPACAQSAISSGIRGSNCATDDFSCICASENLNFALESANDVCDDDDQEALFHAVWEVCRKHILSTRDVDEDDEGAIQGGAQEDTPSPTIASEGTDQATLGSPVLASTPTIASEGTDQATLRTPIPANTPIVAPEGTDQATLQTPVPASISTLATENPNQATLSTPTIIAAPTTPLPTSATSLVTDTREFSHPSSSSLDSSNNVVTTQQAADPSNDPNGVISATTTSPGPEDTALLSSNGTRNSTSSLRGQDPSSTMGEAGSEVAVSVGALVVAVAGLTWVFAEF